MGGVGRDRRHCRGTAGGRGVIVYREPSKKRGLGVKTLEARGEVVERLK